MFLISSTCVARSILITLISANLIRSAKVQIIKAHYNNSLFSCYVISCTNIPLSTLFSSTFSLCHSIVVK